MARRDDPYKNFNFRVVIDGIAHAGFSEVELGASVVEVVEYREGTDLTHARKVTGLNKTADVTMKRGVIASAELFNWFQEVVKGSAGFRKDVTIVVLGDDGSEQARFVVHAAWPRKFAVGALNAKGNDVLIELLELANEGIERVA